MIERATVSEMVGTMREMARRLEVKAAHVLRGDGSLAVTSGMLREAADVISTLRVDKSEAIALREALAPFVDLRHQPEGGKVILKALNDMAPITVTVTKAQMKDAAMLIYKRAPTKESPNAQPTG